MDQDPDNGVSRGFGRRGDGTESHINKSDQNEEILIGLDGEVYVVRKEGGGMEKSRPISAPARTIAGFLPPNSRET
jgi:hypothetical protein